MINKNRNTDEAKSIEVSVANQIELKRGVDVVLMPEYAKFDYIFIKNKAATAIAEFRHRPTTSINQYNDICLDVAKVESILVAARSMDLRAFFLVKWADSQIMIADISKHQRQGVISRRINERANDREQAAYFYNTSQFKKLIDYD